MTALSITSGASPVVDEPIGARSSLGLTLWHMSYDADHIRRFHEFLRERDIGPPITDAATNTMLMESPPAELLQRLLAE